MKPSDDTPESEGSSGAPAASGRASPPAASSRPSGDVNPAASRKDDAAEPAQPARDPGSASGAGPAPEAEPASRAEPAPKAEPASRAEHAPKAEPASRAESARRAEPASEPAPAERRASRGGRALSVAAVILAAAAIVATFYQWQRSDGVSREAARRLQEGDQRIAQLEALVKQSQDQTREIHARSVVLEAKLTEAIGQQSQLERMYKDIAQESISTTLADVENAVSIASQQLLVSGNVRGALLALQDADGRLKRIKQPEALGLRRLIATDIERLKAVPNVDVVALALRLDSVAASVAQLPLLASLTPPPAPPQQARQAQPQPGTFSFERLASTGRQGWEALIAELGHLFRVNRVDSPDALLLSPQQQYFVRENLRLTLLAARLGLLAQSEPLLRADLDRAIGWLATYYDRDSKAVTNAIESLRQVRASRVRAELPSLGDTLAAIRTARAARDPNS